MSKEANASQKDKKDMPQLNILEQDIHYQTELEGVYFQTMKASFNSDDPTEVAVKCFLISRLQVIGYANLTHLGTVLPRLSSLYIPKHWRHKGFGKLFIQHIQATVAGCGYEGMTLIVNPQNEFAQRLYVNRGFFVSYQYEDESGDYLMTWRKSSVLVNIKTHGVFKRKNPGQNLPD